jgi:hypothetical protein
MRRLLSLLFLVAPLLLVTACGGETREAAPPTAAASPTAVESLPTATAARPAAISKATRPVPTVEATATPVPTFPPPPPSPTPQPAAPDFGPFAKTWGRHGFGITISTSGEATATWRVYKWCSDDPTPPCDDMVDSQIISGGQATIVFTEVVGETAHGRVTASTDESTLAGGVSLTLQPYDMALLESDAWAGQETLCGPNYWQEAPDWLKEQSPCGA